jgi:CRP-like cAMP-binding protein
MKSSAVLDEYFSKFPTRSYKKRWPIVQAGDHLRKIFYLKKGYVRVYSMTSEGKEITLLVYKPGNFFPLLIALQPNVEYPYWVETITPAEITTVPVESFVDFCKTNPELLLTVSNEIMARLDSSLQRIEYMAFGSVYKKIASILVIGAKRFGKFKGKHIILDLPLTHKDIGLLIAASRETVSTEIKKLEKKGIIGYKGKQLVIKDLKKLDKEASLLTKAY